MDESKHEIHSQVDAITAGTASMVNLTAGMTTVLHQALSVSLPVCVIAVMWEIVPSSKTHVGL